MSRGLDNATVAALTAKRVMPALFLYASFGDGDVRVWNGYGPISWAGQTWLGLSNAGGECLGQISTMTEDASSTAQTLNISISGVDPTMLTHALTNVIQGKPCVIWVNLFNDSMQIVGTILTYAGLIDQPTIEEGSDSCTITVSVESRLADLQRAPMRRWTDQDQRSRFPNDAGFSFVSQLQNWSAMWGASK